MQKTNQLETKTGLCSHQTIPKPDVMLCFFFREICGNLLVSNYCVFTSVCRRNKQKGHLHTFNKQNRWRSETLLEHVGCIIFGRNLIQFTSQSKNKFKHNPSNLEIFWPGLFWIGTINDLESMPAWASQSPCQQGSILLDLSYLWLHNT